MDTMYSNPRGGMFVHVRIGDNVVVNLKKTVSIHCGATGTPKPKVIWKFNGRPINTMRNLVDRLNGTIVINKVAWQNKGTYECFHVNKEGLDSAVTKVTVYGKYGLIDLLWGGESLMELAR